MLSSFQSWLSQPFSTNMSAARWLAFVGLLLAIWIFWTIVLKHLEEV